MQSRMERYYQTTEPDNSEPTKRSKINEELYNRIYDDVEYSNIEGIVTTEKTNEIDITKIKEMLKNREDFRKEREFSRIVKRPAEPVMEAKVVEDDKNYDIREIISKAKVDRSEDSDYHSLKNTQYDILKGISIKDHLDKKPYIAEDDDSLKDLINTITNTSLLNKLGDRDLSLNLLNDLKSDGNTMITHTNAIKRILESEKEEPEVIANTLDKSFYNTGLMFGEQDFEELKDMSTALRKNNFLIKVLIFILAVITTTVLIFTLFMYLK